jgi:hypothetical protein
MKLQSWYMMRLIEVVCRMIISGSSFKASNRINAFAVGLNEV